MDKVWYIKIFEVEGPFSLQELKADPRITPDTLAWRPGLPKWMPIRDIPELKKLFKDENEVPKLKIAPVPSNGELVLDFHRDPYHFLWLILVLAIALYLFIQYYTL